ARVVAATEVMTGRPCYEVEFSDGEVIVADAEHLWKTTTRASRRQQSAAVTSYHWSPDQLEHVRRVTESALAEPDRLVSHDRLVTTAERAVTLRAGGSDRSVNHAVEQCAPLQLPGSRLPLPPYLLGVWLGDGATAACWNRDGTVQGILRTIGVLDNKHIPQQYLRASEV